jgi:polar amino acid transport system substrate-binding protein
MGQAGAVTIKQGRKGDSGMLSKLLVKTSARLFAGAVVLSLGSMVITTHALADQLDRVKARGKLIIGIRNDVVPFGYLDASGKNIGFEVEIAHRVAKELLGDENAVELVPVIASNRIEFLNAGRIDVIFATLGVNADRAKIIDFTEEYYSMAGMVLMAPKDAEYKSWDDVRGKKLCGSQGNMYNRPLSEQMGAELVLFGGPAEIYSAFQSGRCEAIAYDGPALNLKLAEDGWKEKYKIALQATEYVPIAGGVRKNEPAFLEAVNKAIVKAESEDLMLTNEVKYNLGSSEYVQKRAEEAKKAK